MSKRICTASLFVGFVVALVLSWRIQVPDLFWNWAVGGNHFIPLPIFMLSDIIFPLSGLVCVGGLAWAVWFTCDLLCDWLRRITGRE
jgi:hypothetical protein